MKLSSICRDREQAAQALCKRICLVLSDAIVQKGYATLVVSGGSSPQRLFKLLSEQPVEWSKVYVIPSDERLVSLDSEERNESMVRRILFNNYACDATMVSLVSDPTDAVACEEFANQNLGAIEGSFDAVVIGMGDDGHTASLFPDAPNIQDALDSNLDCIVQTVPSQKRVRISLTPKALLNSKEINLLVFGEKKLEVLQKANEPGPLDQYPIRVSLHQPNIPVTTYWAP